MKTTIKTQLTKGLTIMGIGAVMFGAIAVVPAKADDRCNDNRAAGFDVRITSNERDRLSRDDRDRDRHDRDDHRDDHGRFDGHDR